MSRSGWRSVALVSEMKRRDRSGKQSHGMTMLEVLIAILLFAVFTGVFVMVTELMAAMMSSDQSARSSGECSSPPLDRACIEVVFDDLVDTLQESTFSLEVLRESMHKCERSARQLFNLNYDQFWPDDYEICIYDYGSENPAFAEDLNSRKPGLYLLQAQPKRPSPLKRPVQRLFCRPSAYCL